jgi:hypothetical protein
MNKVTHITPLVAVTGALQPADFAAIVAAGFKSVLSNLPDGESAAYPTSAQEAELRRSRRARLSPYPHHQGRPLPTAWSMRVGDATRAAGSSAGAGASGVRSAVAPAAARVALPIGRSCARDADGRRPIWRPSATSSKPCAIPASGAYPAGSETPPDLAQARQQFTLEPGLA